jgi:peptide/nickel transport system ATP-binding protein
MLDLRGARNLTYLFITHDLSIAWVIADRIAVMYLGKIMEIGPAEAVISAPRHPYTAALVSVAPSPEPPAAGERAKRTILVGETPDAAAIPSGCRFRTRCPLAFEKCVEEPPLIDVGDGHASACWLAERATTEAGIADLLPNARRTRQPAATGLASPAAQTLTSPAD